MGSVVSTGVGSGLDVAGLVEKLLAAEGGPKTLRLNAEEAKVQAKLSALGTLRSALASFRDSVGTLKSLDSFRGRQVALSKPEFIAGTAGTGAAPGTYSIEVQQLAQAHKLQSNTFATGPTTPVGTGTLTIVTGLQIFQVEITAANNTVAGIADAINKSGAGAKVIASVVSGSNDTRLTLTARASGTSNEMTVTQSGGDGGLASLVYPAGGGFNEIKEALDAKVLIDGIAASSQTNTISGVIAGVDIQVLKANLATETTELSVGYNSEGGRKVIDQLVKSYNGVIDAVNSVAAYNSETRQGGPLFGDAGVRNIVYQLRRELTSSVAGIDGPFAMLGQIGISAQLDGKLSVDSAKLEAAFTADFDSVGKLFAAPDTGIAVKLGKLLDPYLSSNGIFDGRSASLKSSIDHIGEQREALNLRLAALQTRYTKQFNALDGLLTQLQGTSNFLTQQLRNLPGSAPLNRNE
jgi:flagellar hook-associated protein 2